jgi:hypothetical protein
MRTLGRFLFWDFTRGSWQYDVMVGLILAFIFLSPRYVFQDKPRPASVQMLPAEPGTGLFWIAPELLEGVASEKLVEKASALVNGRFKIRQTIMRVEPILDEEKDITGYMAYARP